MGIFSEAFGRYVEKYRHGNPLKGRKFEKNSVSNCLKHYSYYVEFGVSLGLDVVKDKCGHLEGVLFESKVPWELLISRKQHKKLAHSIARQVSILVAQDKM
jgi:hypothetical protein